MQDTVKSSPDRVSKRSHRPRGSIFLRADSPHYYIAYSVHGKKFRENSHKKSHREARRLLDQRLGAIANGDVIPSDVSKTAVGELFEMVLRDYRVNSLKSIDAAEQRIRLHLGPFFLCQFESGKFLGGMRAVQVSGDVISNYVTSRQLIHASNASINRELSILKRGFTLGLEGNKVLRLPKIPHLKELNIRKGFLEPSARTRLAIECSTIGGIWLRTMFELGCLCGWRKSELVNLRVNQVDLAERTIRLNAGETKNDSGRLVVLTDAAYLLVRECARGKSLTDFLFTRSHGGRVRDFRGVWHAACCAAGLGRWICPKCKGDDGELFTVDNDNQCPQCSTAWKAKHLRYSGLIFHDLRRSAVRSMVRSGIPERVAMTISGHKTRSVFDRYNIVSEGDLREAARKMNLLNSAGTELSPVSDTVTPPPNAGTVN